MVSRLKILVISAAIAAGAAATAFAFGQHRVDQSALQFSEQTVKMKRGETLVFSNSDRTSHNITVTGGSMDFDGGLQRPGQDLEGSVYRRGQVQGELRHPSERWR